MWDFSPFFYPVGKDVTEDTGQLLTLERQLEADRRKIPFSYPPIFHANTY